MMIDPQIALPKFLSFTNFHAFWDGSLRMIWNSNMKELNVDDRDHMMNLCNNTTTMPNI
jgi:hypothetical protein